MGGREQAEEGRRDEGVEEEEGIKVGSNYHWLGLTRQVFLGISNIHSCQAFSTTIFLLSFSHLTGNEAHFESDE